MKTIFSIIALAVLALAALYLITSKKNSQGVINAETFKKLHKENPGIVIDVRTRDEYNTGHLTVADYHLDVLNRDFENQLNSLDKTETYYLYCRSGNRSGKASKIMNNKGFDNVYNIGGYQNLVNAGLESE